MSQNRDFDQAKADARQTAEQAKEATRQNINQARDVAGEKAEQAKNVARDKAEQAKDAADRAGRRVERELENDGVYNPKGLAVAAAGPLFLALIPVTNWISQPGGFLEKGVNGVIGGVGLLASAGASTHIAQGGKIAALAAIYATATYALSGAASAGGQDAGTQGGRDNNHPRAALANLQGLPLRLYSAHQHLMEMFPGWAIAAALAQVISPNDQHIINLLGLHVIAKLFVHYPAYVLNNGGVRSGAHFFATSAILNVLLQLARKPLV
ncbi:unnamed protein product [Zymoseptoria tritici ST99CH_3D1]|uniref:Uncharacterized protein n=2 Tax=Zymoseptoria tritici TaxID=1047171 RepID=A0A2H1H433_ZYMTR|nr:unnamed protein product [Zymoseptoria tritici ST99CH_1E4]SMR63711.1 unnamed protein product [Zymoseptoria tritici ST99CH_3D1]